MSSDCHRWSPTGEYGIHRIVTIDDKPIWISDRALTLIQPWAYLMTAIPEAYRKNIENRPTGFVSINFRGPVWVHASGKLSRLHYDAAMSAATERCVPSRYLPTWEEVVVGARHGLRRSAIIGQFVIAGYLEPTANPTCDWHFPHQHGFVTRDASSLATPVPCPGHLGFWRISNETAQHLATQAAM